MMNRQLAHEHHTHQYQIGVVASGYIGAGGSARFRWDGLQWQPEGRTDAATLLGPLTDAELRFMLCPDMSTILRLGPHWSDAAAARFQKELVED